MRWLSLLVLFVVVSSLSAQTPTPPPVATPPLTFTNITSGVSQQVMLTVTRYSVCTVVAGSYTDCSPEVVTGDSDLLNTASTGQGSLDSNGNLYGFKGSPVQSVYQISPDLTWGARIADIVGGSSCMLQFNSAVATSPYHGIGYFNGAANAFYVPTYLYYVIVQGDGSCTASGPTLGSYGKVWSVSVSAVVKLTMPNGGIKPK